MELMAALHIDLTGGAERHTAAGAFDTELIHPAYLHHIEVHVGGGLDGVCFALTVYDGDGDDVFHRGKYRSEFTEWGELGELRWYDF